MTTIPYHPKEERKEIKNSPSPRAEGKIAMKHFYQKLFLPSYSRTAWLQRAHTTKLERERERNGRNVINPRSKHRLRNEKWEREKRKNRKKLGNNIWEESFFGNWRKNSLDDLAVSVFGDGIDRGFA